MHDCIAAAPEPGREPPQQALKEQVKASASSATKINRQMVWVRNRSRDGIAALLPVGTQRASLENE